jgi:RNA polymerase sigma factor (sigma-70 family)
VSPPSLRRYRAERLLRTEFSGLRSRVLAIVRSQLRSKGLELDPLDLEACYAQAWHGLYATVLAGEEEVENPSAWLVLVTFRRAIDESRSTARQRLVPQADATIPFASELSTGSRAAPSDAGLRPGGANDPELARELDDRMRLRQVFEGLRTRLTEREREAASLCYLQGLSRAEAAGRMGISESRMRKLMEGRPGRPGVAGKMGELLDTIRAGGWCEQQSSLMRAFAFGVLDPGGERHALAAAHCRECPACRAHVASLRGLATVLPLPLLLPSSPAGAGEPGAASGRAAGAGRSEVGRSAAEGAGRAGAGGRSAAGAARLGRGLTGSPWSGLPGSLAVKLAAIALVALGGGYALLGSRAHGSPPVSGLGVPQAPVAGGTLFPAALPRLGSLPRARPRGASAASPAHTVSRPHPAGRAGRHEFGPERVTHESAPGPSSTETSSHPSHSPSRAAREFGVE